MALKSVKESLQTQMSGQDRFLRENMTKLIDHIDKQENMIKEELFNMFNKSKVEEQGLPHQ